MECKQFSCEISNLPKTSSDYSILQLKADLWAHIIKCLQLKDEAKAKVSPEANSNEIPEIVDIQFAKADYSYLDSVQTII